MEGRAARRQQFAAHLRPLVDQVGGPASFVGHTGYTQVDAWLGAVCIPRVETLVEICGQFGWDLPTMLEAAGKPPVDALRAASGTAFHATLPALLQAFRDERGLETREAAAALRLDRYEFSRLATGSGVPATLHRCARLARGLGLTVAGVLDAAAVADGHPLRAELARKTSGDAGVVRDALEAAGVDSWEPDEVRHAARATSVPAHRLKALLDGKGQLTAHECAKLARLGSRPLAGLLRHVGFTAGEARRVAAALADPAHARRGQRRSYETVPELVKAYRLVAGLSQRQTAQAAGVQRTVVTRLELGDTVPEPVLLVRIADAVGAPLDRVLPAAGWKK